jgi:hypothetical protein
MAGQPGDDGPVGEDHAGVFGVFGVFGVQRYETVDVDSRVDGRELGTWSHQRPHSPSSF